LTEPVSRFAFKMNDPPRLNNENILIELANISDLAKSARFRRGICEASGGKSIIVEFAETSDMELDIKVVHQTGDILSVAISKSFDQDVPLTFQQIEKRKKAFGKKLIELPKETERLKRELEYHKRKRKELQDELASLPPLHPKYVKLQGDIYDQTRQIRTKDDKINELERDINRNQHKVNQMKNVDSLLSAIHERSKIDFQIFAILNKHQRVLLFSSLSAD
jgi:hypothetical protein